MNRGFICQTTKTTSRNHNATTSPQMLTCGDLTVQKPPNQIFFEGGMKDFQTVLHSYPRRHVVPHDLKTQKLL